MVRRGSIHQRMRAARIIRDHPTDGRPRTGRYIWTETKSVRMQKMIQLIENDSRADPNRAALQINVGNLFVVTGEIDDQSFPKRAACQTRARAARNDGNARLARRLDY